MKKYFCVLSIFLAVSLCVGAYENKFYDALQTCTPYNSNGNITTDGMAVKVREQIVGMQNDKCVYKEYVNMSGVDTCVTCKFSKSQISELVNVMKAYSTVQEYTGEEINTSSVSAVQNNPVVKVWNKYLSDKNVCTLDVMK